MVFISIQGHLNASTRHLRRFLGKLSRIVYIYINGRRASDSLQRFCFPVEFTNSHAKGATLKLATAWASNLTSHMSICHAGCEVQLLAKVKQKVTPPLQNVSLMNLRLTCFQTFSDFAFSERSHSGRFDRRPQANLDGWVSCLPKESHRAMAVNSASDELPEPFASPQPRSQSGRFNEFNEFVKQKQKNIKI